MQDQAPITTEIVTDAELRESLHEEQFFASESHSGTLLIAVTMLAMLWANSPWAQSYHDIWHLHTTLPILGKQHLHAIINDGLMAVFFLVVGLEIKREALLGSLASRRKAGLPVLAALCGIIVPALIYLCATSIGAPQQGWGVPVATDIAFALAMLQIFGRNMPAGARAFLSALAISDDIGAIAIIGFFYSSALNIMALAVAFGACGLLYALNKLKIRLLLPYLAIGMGLWLAMFHSGVHPTIAGVLLAAAIPLRGTDSNADLSPLGRLEKILEPFSAWFVIPLFAFANAGIKVDLAHDGVGPVAMAIAAALVIGKPLGICLFSRLAVAFNIGELPPNVTWRHLFATSCLGGIGFTVSLFIAALAFAEGSNNFDQAKVGIILGSLLSVATGAWALRIVAPKLVR